MREPVTVIAFASAFDVGGLFAWVTATTVLGCVELVVCGCAADAFVAVDLSAVAAIAGAADAATMIAPVRSAVVPSSFQLVMWNLPPVHL
jgi:hypothetical protein